MTKTTTAKANTKSNESTVESRVAVYEGISQSIDRRNRALRAIIAHELWLNLEDGKFRRGAAAEISEAFGMVKTDVAVIAIVVRLDPKARAAAGKLDVLALANHDSTEFAAATKTGAMFSRGRADELREVARVDAGGTPKAATVTAEGKAKGKGQAEEIDGLAIAHDWLMSATPEQFAGRHAAFVEMLARVEDEFAAAQAEAAELVAA